MASSDPLSIRQLEVFVALDDQGSFTRAARHLNLSQSTVSGHIADLERRLGVRLVDRDRGGVRPTAAGRALLRPARQVLQAERNARMAIESLSGLLSGTLVVGGSTTPSSYFLPAIFARFHARYPGIALQLVTGDSRDIADRVRSADVEVAVVGAPPGSDDLFSAKIGEDQMVLVVGPNHALAGKERIAPEELAEVYLVVREEGSGTRSAIDGALQELLGPGPFQRLRVACEVGSTEAVKAAVREGLGAAFTSNLAVHDELKSGALAAVRVDGFAVTRGFHLVTREESLLGPAAKAFRDFCLE